jgi:hypothetical protein
MKSPSFRKQGFRCWNIGIDVDLWAGVMSNGVKWWLTIYYTPDTNTRIMDMMRPSISREEAAKILKGLS